MTGEGELAQLQPEEIPGERGQIFAAVGALQVRSPSSLPKFAPQVRSGMGPPVNSGAGSAVRSGVG